MTPIAVAREQITARATDALILNDRQALHLYDPTPEIDSALEHVVAAIRLINADPDRAEQHLRAATSDLTAAHKLNRSEREHEQAICDEAGRAGRRSELTVKDAARELREPLATLANPIIKGAPRSDAFQVVQDVIRRATPGLLCDEAGRVRAGLRGELNSVAKATAFERVAREMVGVAA